MKKFSVIIGVLFIAGVLCVAAFLSMGGQRISPEVERASVTVVGPGSNEETLAWAFENRQHGLQLLGSGRVSKLLLDDNKGNRHQRFILRLDSGQTLLIAHNIDKAPKINTLSVGDRVRFNGVYEWNADGGTIHWTHRDLSGSHEAGWLIHKGRKYQ